eukprot:gene305-9958_t
MAAITADVPRKTQEDAVLRKIMLESEPDSSVIDSDNESNSDSEEDLGVEEFGAS